MNELALFAGAGGGILGGKLLGWTTVCAVEYEPYATAVLIQRQNDGILPAFPIWDDVRTFDGRAWSGLVDVVSAGFPCQPYSSVGKRQGASDERNLWPDTVRIIGEVEPRFAFFENVTELSRNPYWITIRADLGRAGFREVSDCELSAYTFGAPQVRNRIWFVADAAGERPEPPRQLRHGQHAQWSAGSDNEVDSRFPPHPADMDSWVKIIECEPGLAPGIPKSAVHGVVDGLANRVDRLKAIGNGQVPAVASAAWKILTVEMKGKPRRGAK